MKRAGLLLLTVVLAWQAHGQAMSGPTTNALTCGTLKAESSRTSSISHWTISGPSGKTTETGVLRSGPRFECIDGAILIMEFTSSAGHSFFEAYFADGTSIGYGRQQIDRRGIASFSRFKRRRASHRRFAPRSTITAVSTCRQIPFNHPLGRTASSKRRGSS